MNRRNAGRMSRGAMPRPRTTPVPPLRSGRFNQRVFDTSMKKILLLATALLALSLTTGCASMADATAARGTGTTHVYDQPYESVWDALNACVKETDLTIVSANKDTGTLLAKRSMTAFSYGENVAIFVDRVTGKVSTRVEIVNKRVLATNITAPDWDVKLFKALDARLKPN